MRHNPLQFAVVREDPNTAIDAITRFNAASPLLIASGGCTFLSLKQARPDLRITLIDPNPAQLEHVENKIQALQNATTESLKAGFNIENDSPDGLNQKGNFESLFRGLRQFLCEFIMGPGEWRELFEGELRPEEAEERIFANPYWRTAFELFFCDALLNTMFGPDATQHAPSGSYPGYFQRAFERGFTMKGARDNYFLHHVFLGHYLDDPRRLPSYLVSRPKSISAELRCQALSDVDDIERFDFIDLSNIFDWMSPDACVKLADRLSRHAKAGTVVLWRQLNNTRNLEALFGKEFGFDHHYARELYRADRSMFYSSIHLGVKR